MILILVDNIFCSILDIQALEITATNFRVYNRHRMILKTSQIVTYAQPAKPAWHQGTGAIAGASCIRI